MAYRLTRPKMVIVLGLVAGAGWGGTAHATNINISVTYGNGVTQQEMNAFGTVVSQFEAAITNPITVNIEVDAGSVNGQSLGDQNVSGSFTNTVEMGAGATAATTYSNTISALQTYESSIGYVLPHSDPTGGGHYYYMPTAEVKALGLTGTYSVPTLDGYIGFSSQAGEFYFDTTPVAGAYSFIAAAQHELEEVLGRTSALNNSGTTSGFIANPFDLFRYSSAGTTSFSETAAAYASVNGGVTDLGSLENMSSSGDRSDWLTGANTTSTDSQNALLTTGANAGLSISDEDVLKALGYSIASSNGAGLFAGANAPINASSSVNAVPEPGGLALLGFAGTMLGWVRARRPHTARSPRP
jgi:hypothetical protein